MSTQGLASYPPFILYTVLINKSNPLDERLCVDIISNIINPRYTYNIIWLHYSSACYRVPSVQNTERTP